MLAHIAGVPVEETALGFAPVALAAGGVAGAKLRWLSRSRRLSRRRRAALRRAGARPPHASRLATRPSPLHHIATHIHPTPPPRRRG